MMYLCAMTKESPKPVDDYINHPSHEYELILFNDDVNTFEFVIQALIDVCEHEQLQAEQCAMIAHFKGHCGVKKGDWETLNNKHQVLSDLGLMVKVT